MSKVIYLDPDTKKILDRTKQVEGPPIPIEVASVFAKILRELGDPSKQMLVSFSSKQRNVIEDQEKVQDTANQRQSEKAGAKKTRFRVVPIK